MNVGTKLKNNYFELRDQLNIHPEILNYLDKKIPEVLSKFKEPKKDDAPGRFRNQHALYICVNGSKIPYIGKHSSDDLSTDEYKGSSSILSDEEKSLFTRYDLILTNTAKGAYWLEGQILNQDFINEFGYYTTGLVYNATKGGEYRNGLTQEQALSNLFEAHGGDISLIGNYTGAKDKHIFRCKEGHEWEATYNNIVNLGRNCPKCSANAPKYCVIKFPNGKIEIYNSLNEAERQTGLYNSNIKSCCDGKTNHAKGYQCMYLEDYENGKKFSNKKFTTKTKIGPIVNIETGKYFPSANEAEKQAKNFGWKKVYQTNIHYNILGKYKSAGIDSNGNKLHWRKATKEEIKANPDTRNFGNPIVGIGEDVLFFDNSRHTEEYAFGHSHVSAACRGIYHCKKDPHYYKGYLWYYQDEVLIVDKE